MKTINKQMIFWVLLVLVSIGPVLGQNYQSVYYDREAYFETESFGLTESGWGPCSPCRIGIRVASVLPDTMYYVFPTYWIDGIFPHIPRPSWLGDTMQILADGTEFFHNKNEELITLKARLEHLETWPVFQLPDSAYLEGKITAIIYEEVLGQMDSVKTITFQVKDSDGETINHEINGVTIRIGKHLGFVKACDFYHFPISQEPKFLIGQSNPDIGEPLLNGKAIFNQKNSPMLASENKFPSRAWRE